MHKIELYAQARKDCDYWRKHNPKRLEKIEQLLEAIRHNPFEGIGKPEPLQHNLQNYWSRRISDKHRLLYEIEGNIVFVHNCRGHYNK